MTLKKSAQAAAEDICRMFSDSIHIVERELVAAIIERNCAPLEAKLKSERARSHDLANRVQVLMGERDGLREALEFYADPWKAIKNSADPDAHVPDFYDELEFGETARKALAAPKEPQT